ncbi:hypothetical protein [Roseibium marinum]|uniref:hypothetical protein n=1 Tax=Roseibium marinum TaxID=281252 RepID=UPI0011AF1BCA|nr:hypothetical protein [Roseibium marinum]
MSADLVQVRPLTRPWLGYRRAGCMNNGFGKILQFAVLLTLFTLRFYDPYFPDGYFDFGLPKRLLDLKPPS